MNDMKTQEPQERENAATRVANFKQWATRGAWTVETTMGAHLDRIARRQARDAWNAAVAAMHAVTIDDSTGYRDALITLDASWRAAGLPYPWYPSMVSQGYSESGHTATDTRS